MAKTGKKLVDAYKKFDREARFPLAEAVALVKTHATAKFDETIEIAMNLGVDPRHAGQNLRSAVSLPHGTGQEVRVAVFAKGDKAEEAKAAGADVVGADDLAEMVQKGEINFERCIATPDMMGVVGRLGRILGPRNLMPNPKLGTVTPMVANAVKLAKSGQVQFRTERQGIVHARIGKASFSGEHLKENATAFIDAIRALKPAESKGIYIQHVTLSSSQGVG
ncbi:MAG: 50S ribosomal protein L1, partial [Alphaproteobacteria bacterium]|nr:50S ribosomal protein L1 [Alphaproteobacteria bacterium]